MKKGFTLIELMIVIIIIGVLATIGIVQYQAAIEKSRGAEARSVLGFLRATCAPIWMEFNGTDNCDLGRLGMGTGANEVPTSCPATNGKNFFSYEISTAGTSNAGTIALRANRCTTGGKYPPGKTGTVLLTINYANGSDVWSTTGAF